MCKLVSISNQWTNKANGCFFCFDRKMGKKRGRKMWLVTWSDRNDYTCAWLEHSDLKTETIQTEPVLLYDSWTLTQKHTSAKTKIIYQGGGTLNLPANEWAERIMRQNDWISAASLMLNAYLLHLQSVKKLLVCKHNCKCNFIGIIVYIHTHNCLVSACVPRFSYDAGMFTGLLQKHRRLKSICFI